MKLIGATTLFACATAKPSIRTSAGIFAATITYLRRKSDRYAAGAAKRRKGMGAMSRFSEEAWARTAALRGAIHRLKFNTELAAGTLAPERFRFYILQDAIYLGEYARVLAL